MVTRKDFLAGVRYESPVVEVYEVSIEGALCASTQAFALEEIEWNW